MKSLVRIIITIAVVGAIVIAARMYNNRHAVTPASNAMPSAAAVHPVPMHEANKEHVPVLVHPSAPASNPAQSK